MHFKYFLTVFLLLIAMINPLNAANLNSSKITETCDRISGEIDTIMRNNPEMDLDCVSQVTSVVTHLGFASIQARQGNYPVVILYLLSIEKLMRNIQIRPEFCSYYAPFIKPYIPIIMDLKKEIADEIDKAIS